MKLLIYGAGVIGSIFGARLALAGHDVTMLARGKRLAEIKESLMQRHRLLPHEQVFHV